MNKQLHLAGIDYGSKIAGTTVIMFLHNGQLSYFQSKKKKDADEFIFQHLTAVKPAIVFIDAPLSLPGVYTDTQQYSNYFYRKADSDLKAMSPMFLGGLTARAMQLQARLSKENIELQETYPAALARHLELKELSYKKDLKKISIILEKLNAQFSDLQISLLNLTNWHQVDALLALISAWRFVNKQHEKVGYEKEGVIIF